MRKRVSFRELQDAVVDADLCCGCGACVGVCRSEALAIDLRKSHEPAWDESRCNGCGLCCDVCPGQGYPVVAWATPPGDEGTEMLPQRGPVRQYLRGHATDPEIRLNSASGGIATALLLHLLETGQVDEVAVVAMEDERPVARLTRDPQVVRDAMMSKYGPVPMLATLIPSLRDHPRRIAVTMTPCQLAGWRKAAASLPSLQKSEVLVLGLFCGQIQSYDALASIAATLGVEYPGEARFVAWRDGIYPGSARFDRSDGTSATKPLYAWLDVAVPHFSLHRCSLCPDGANWMADLTLGDIHGSGHDETVIVCRTRRAEAALESAKQAHQIDVVPLIAEQVERCVVHAITRSKLFPALAVIEWLNRRGRPAPQFDYPPLKTLAGRTAGLRPAWILKYRLIRRVRRGWQRRFLLRHPRWMERVGHFLYYFPATVPGYSWLLGARKLLHAAVPRRGRGPRKSGKNAP